MERAGNASGGGIVFTATSYGKKGSEERGTKKGYKVGVFKLTEETLKIRERVKTGSVEGEM